MFDNPKPLVAAQNVKKLRTQPKTNIFYTIFVRQTCGGLVEMARLRLDSALGFKKDWLGGAIGEFVFLKKIPQIWRRPIHTITTYVSAQIL